VAWFAMTCATDDGTTTEQLVARCYFESPREPGNTAPIRWDTRQFGGFQATWLSRRLDSITIGQPSGILRYPNMIGPSCWQDNVANDDTGGTGIPFKFRLILGSLYQMTLQNVYTGIKVEHSATGTGSYVMRLYMNAGASPFDTKYFLVSENPHTRNIPAVGSLRYMKVECEITSDVANIGKFNISTLEFYYIPRPDKGPR